MSGHASSSKESKGVFPALALGPKTDIKTLLESKCQIFFWSGLDRKLEMLEKLMVEWNMSPFVNPRLEEGKADDANRIIIIYCRNFFNDDTDFAFIVKGYKNMVSTEEMMAKALAYDVF
jgi:hypothetical protein